MRDGLASALMIMVPDIILREQSLNENETTACLQRYDIRLPQSLRTYTIRDRPNMQRMVNHPLIAVTTQMVQSQRLLFGQWVDYMKKHYGVPPLVCVDEAHTHSDANTWGDAMDALAQAGAFIVLCTATPMRADGRLIPGFEVEPIRTETARRGDGGRRYEGTRTTFRLKAHHITSFRDAWLERPSPLCKITLQTFTVDLDDIGITGTTATTLADLPDSEAQSNLGRVLRNPMVVRGAMDYFARTLRNRRLAHPTAAGIIFVGNDDIQNDESSNYHAHMVKDVLKELAPELDVRIATSTTEDPTGTIQRFSKGGIGDVLVCKQMAGRGLDTPRLKVECDLSPVRQEAAFIQRLTRVTTRWEDGDNGTVLDGDYIGPEESRLLGLFKAVVTDQGGEMARVGDWQERDTEELGSGERYTPPLRVIEPTGVSHGTALEDSEGVVGPGKFIDIVDAFCSEHPKVLDDAGKAPIAATFEKLLKAVVGKDASLHGGPWAREGDMSRQHIIHRNDAPPQVIDTEKQRKDICSLINDEVKRLAQRDWRKANPGRHRGSQEEVAQGMKEKWRWLYDKVGVKPGIRLHDISDMAVLQKLVDTLEEERRNV